MKVALPPQHSKCCFDNHSSLADTHPYTLQKDSTSVPNFFHHSFVAIKSPGLSNFTSIARNIDDPRGNLSNNPPNEIVFGVNFGFDRGWGHLSWLSTSGFQSLLMCVSKSSQSKVKKGFLLFEPKQPFWWPYKKSRKIKLVEYHLK